MLRNLHFLPSTLKFIAFVIYSVSHRSQQKRLISEFITFKVNYTHDGLEAIVFTAQGDMRQALNNLQSTHNGFEIVNSQNVFKVCDEPHPMLIKDMLINCKDGDIRRAYKVIEHLWGLGYAAEDIIKNIFKVTKTMDLEEALKLSFIKEIGTTHMRIADGLCSLIQMSGLLARLCSAAKSH